MIAEEHELPLRHRERAEAARGSEQCRAIHPSRLERQIFRDIGLVDAHPVALEPALGVAARNRLACARDDAFDQILLACRPEASEIAEGAGDGGQGAVVVPWSLPTPPRRARKDDDVPWLRQGAASKREAIDEDPVPAASVALQGRLHRAGGNAVELDDEGLNERDDEDRHPEVEDEGRP